MSGHGGAQLAKRAAEIGVNEVLRKPLHRRDLAESLARVLGKSLSALKLYRGRSKRSMLENAC